MKIHVGWSDRSISELSVAIALRKRYQDLLITVCLPDMYSSYQGKPACNKCKLKTRYTLQVDCVQNLIKSPLTGGDKLNSWTHFRNVLCYGFNYLWSASPTWHIPIAVHIAFRWDSLHRHAPVLEETAVQLSGVRSYLFDCLTPRMCRSEVYWTGSLSAFVETVTDNRIPS
jgi:hypothetical protein